MHLGASSAQQCSDVGTIVIFTLLLEKTMCRAVKSRLHGGLNPSLSHSKAHGVPKTLSPSSLGADLFSASLGLQSSHFLHYFSLFLIVISACHCLPMAIAARALPGQRCPRMEE